jgi:hypothetical protein
MVCCAATNWPSLCSLSPRLSTWWGSASVTGSSLFSFTGS